MLGKFIFLYLLNSATTTVCIVYSVCIYTRKEEKRRRRRRTERALWHRAASYFTIIRWNTYGWIFSSHMHIHSTQYIWIFGGPFIRLNNNLKSSSVSSVSLANPSLKFIRHICFPHFYGIFQMIICWFLFSFSVCRRPFFSACFVVVFPTLENLCVIIRFGNKVVCVSHSKRFRFDCTYSVHSRSKCANI